MTERATIADIAQRAGLSKGAVVEVGSTEQVFSNPQSPYTQMLLDAVPRLHERWGEPSSNGAPPTQTDND